MTSNRSTFADGKTIYVSVIVVAPALNNSGARLTSRFDAFLGDQLIVHASKTPFLDAARELLDLGFRAETYLIMRHKGSEIKNSLRGWICAAARLTVAEGDRSGIHFQLRKPFPSSAVEAHVAAEQTGLSEHRVAPANAPAAETT